MNEDRSSLSSKELAAAAKSASDASIFLQRLAACLRVVQLAEGKASRRQSTQERGWTERLLPFGDWRWVLQSIERYAHHPDYVRDVATALGLEPRVAIPFQPRMESGPPVRGTLHVMHKPSS